MSEFINSENVEDLARSSYQHFIFDEAEFWDDFDRIKYIKRLFNRFNETGDIKTNLIVNHLIVLFNVFDSKPLLKILFYKLDGYHEILKPFLEVLQRCPNQVNDYTVFQPTLYTSDIIDNSEIVQQLRQRVLSDE